MSRILLAWEQGKGLGHLYSLAGLARTLALQGHEVTLVSRELSACRALLAGTTIHLLMAPHWSRQSKWPTPARNLAELLLRRGYHDKASLAPMVAAWRAIFDLVAPDLLVLDYAPTAALAARGRSIPTLIFSNSYCIPVAGLPLRDYTPWLPAEPERMRRSEAHLLTVCNQLAAQPLTHASELFAADAVQHLDYPLFDVEVARRPNACYLGYATTGSEPVCLPKSEPLHWVSRAPRVFAYLDLNVRGCDPLLAALARSGVDLWCKVASGQESRAQQLLGSRGRVLTQMVDFPTLLRQAVLLVCNGNLGAVCQSLLAGCPMLLLPGHLEHRHNAEQIVKLGAGLLLSSTLSATQMEERLLLLLNSGSFRQAAERGGQLLAQQGSKDPRGQLLGCCQRLLDRG